MPTETWRNLQADTLILGLPVDVVLILALGSKLLLLELVNAGSEKSAKGSKPGEHGTNKAPALVSSSVAVLTIDLWESLKAFLLALGDDVTITELEHLYGFQANKKLCLREGHEKRAADLGEGRSEEHHIRRTLHQGCYKSRASGYREPGDPGR